MDNMRSISETRVMDVVASVRFLVDSVGYKTDVVVSWTGWEDLLTWLEQADDRAIIREWLPRLKAGPDKSGAFRWSDVVDEWDDDTYETPNRPR